MTLRPARPTDIPQIFALERRPEFHKYVGTWPEEQHRATLANPDARYLVSEGNPNDVDGFVILQGLESGHGSVELKRIVVKTPDRGLGRQILEEIIRMAFEEFGAHRLWLEVFENNARARHLYESLGFVREGVLREAVYRGGKYHSLILMSLLDREYSSRAKPRG